MARVKTLEQNMYELKGDYESSMKSLEDLLQWITSKISALEKRQVKWKQARIVLPSLELQEASMDLYKTPRRTKSWKDWKVLRIRYNKLLFVNNARSTLFEKVVRQQGLERGKGALVV